jgi:hypothetical protein
MRTSFDSLAGLVRTQFGQDPLDIDVSWIQTESVDRQSEIVLTAGFNDDSFKDNPIVTVNHDYTRSPVGRSLWRKKVKDGTSRQPCPTRPGAGGQIRPCEALRTQVREGRTAQP